MNKEVIFGQRGGFPLTQDTLSFMQDTGKATAAGLGESLCQTHGSRYLIVQGCEVTNNVAAPGIVVIDGEILPFEGGTVQTYVTVKEVKQSAAFQDGQVREAYKTRIAGFGNSGTLEWSSFRRIESMTNTMGYTYVVDSDQALIDWANKVEGNDYTSVFIKSGIWSCTPDTNVNLSFTGTKIVVGAPGNLLSFKSSAGLGYNYPPEEPGYYMRGVNVEIEYGGTGLAGAFGFAANLYDCTAKCTGNYPTSGEVGQISGFGFCFNLKNCRCTVSSNNGTSGGFAACLNLVDCKATVIGNNSGSFNGGFTNCTPVLNCEANITGSTNGYGFEQCDDISNSKAIVSSNLATSNGKGFIECNNIANCTIDMSVKSSGIGFINCNNIVNCTSKANGAYYATGFSECSNISNCKGVANASSNGNAYGFQQCKNIFGSTGEGSGSYGRGFMSCKYLTNCLGLGSIVAGGRDGNGFTACHVMFGCGPAGVSTTSTYNSCYMLENGTTAVANTATGGYNRS